jgi:hypothetical protein
MLLVVLAGMLLAYSRGDTQSGNPTSSLDLIIIAAILLLAGFSLFSNISKTNLIFGSVLTLVQLLFSVLLIVVAAVVWSSRNSRPEAP